MPYRKTGGGGAGEVTECGGFGVVQQMAAHTDRNPPRKHFQPDRQWKPRKDNRPVSSGCGGPPHNVRRMCKAWDRTCYKCQKLNNCAKVCKANSHQTQLVENDTHSQKSDTLCEDTYTLGQYHTSATQTIPPYICNV